MSVEYYLKRLTPGLVAVSKFEGQTEPSNVYLVVEDGKGDMDCDCPNKRRNAGKNDKHGKMVRYWIEKDEPQGFFDKEGVFHANDFATAIRHGGETGDPGSLDDEGREDDEGL